MNGKEKKRAIAVKENMLILPTYFNHSPPQKNKDVFILIIIINKSLRAQWSLVYYNNRRWVF